jgi:NADPH:quinone reductase-like Zn-dependent oxidoreductase
MAFLSYSESGRIKTNLEVIMKAIVYKKYGSPEVLQMQEVEKPAPDENQVLIQVHAASVNAGDYRMMRANPFLVRLMTGLLKPKNTRLGSDIAGRVEAVGKNVKQFRSGDEVFGCAKGAFAEYVLAKEDHLVLKPANKSFEEAAALPVAALTALQGLRDACPAKGSRQARAAGIRSGQKVLIQGASGGVGMFAVQLAKSFGAEVTAVCSTKNLDMVRAIGADHVIDYTQEDFTRNRQRYDLIFAVNGYHPLSAYKRALSPQGIYICAGGTMPQFMQAILLGSLMSKKGGKKIGSMGIAKINQKDLVYLRELLAAGKIAPVIDRRYPLSEIAEAFRYVEDTHAQGKVVITVI